MPELSEDGKDQVALALILLKDFKTQATELKDWHEVTLMVIGLARHLGVYSNFEKLMSKVPVFEIKPKS